MAQAEARPAPRRHGVNIFEEGKPMWQILLVFLIPLMLSNVLAVGVADDGQHLDRPVDLDAGPWCSIGGLSDHLFALLVRLRRFERQQRLNRPGLRCRRSSPREKDRRHGSWRGALSRHYRCDRRCARFDDDARLAGDTLRHHRTGRCVRARDFPNDAGLFLLLRLRDDLARHGRLDDAVLRTDRFGGTRDRDYAALHRRSLRPAEARRRQCGRRRGDCERGGARVVALLPASSRSPAEVRSRDSLRHGDRLDDSPGGRSHRHSHRVCR